MPLTPDTQSRIRFGLASNPAGEELIKAINVPMFDSGNQVYTGAANVVMAPGQMNALINKTVGGPTQVTLPPNPSLSQIAIVTDAKGDAATNNITVIPAAGTIDGAASQLISTNYSSLIFLYNGTEWNTVAANNSIIDEAFLWTPGTPANFAGTFFQAPRAMIVRGITARIDVAGTDAGAVTATVYKVPSGTAIAVGSALHSGTINLKGTALANQVLALSGNQAALKLAAGDSLGIIFTGVMTAAIGSVTVFLQ